VIPLPGHAPRPVEAADAEAPVALSALDRALASIVSLDRYFDKERFLEGACAAYEMIVTAFAAGDKRALKPLLSPEVFDGFARAIDDRATAGHVMETTFVGIEKADVAEAEVQGKTARIKVRFVAEMISVTRDKDGAVVAGDASKVETLIDGWTFERLLSAADPNWVLVATETME
jgi:predicted lipid-binding transport protein (Tim44 family)